MINQINKYTQYHIHLIENIWLGALGMAMAPVQDGELQQHLKKIKQYYKMDLLVCLLQQQDLEWFGIPNELQQCEKAGLATEHFPIEDMNVPKNIPMFKKLVKKIVEEYLRKGKRVVIHCFGGNGRTGLLVAACFMYEGCTAEQAIIKTRKVRRYAIQTTRQQNFLKTLKFDDQL